MFVSYWTWSSLLQLNSLTCKAPGSTTSLHLPVLGSQSHAAMPDFSHGCWGSECRSSCLLRQCTPRVIASPLCGVDLAVFTSSYGRWISLVPFAGKNLLSLLSLLPSYLKSSVPRGCDLPDSVLNHWSVLLGYHTVLTVIKVEQKKKYQSFVDFYFSCSLAISWSFACPYNFRISLLVFMKKQCGVFLEIRTWKSAWSDLVS